MSTEIKRKILYLVTHSELGGAQVYVLDLARYFQSKGHRVHIASGEDSEGYLFSEAKKSGIATTFLRHTKQRISPFHDTLSLFELYSLLNRVKPDIIHLNSSKIGFVGSIASTLYKYFHALSKKKPVIIYTAHGFVFNEPGFWRSFYGSMLERLSSLLKDKIICVSERDRESALEKHVTVMSKLITIPLGINTSSLSFLPKQEARKLLGLPDGKIVGTVANLYTTKGLDYLVKSAYQIKNQKGTTPHFVIIGEGPERSVLEKLIKQYDLDDRFLLLGQKQDAVLFLKAFDIFVLPSRKEGWPYTILEALNAGLPIVATRVGGIPEMIEDQKNGLLVDPGDVESLTSAITSILSDSALAERLSKVAKPSSSQWDISHMLQETEGVYNSSKKS